MGRRETTKTVFRYDCDRCPKRDLKTTEIGSRIQLGNPTQAGQKFRRYLCYRCTMDLKAFMKTTARF